MDKQEAMEKIRDMLGKASREMIMSQPGVQEAFFDGKMSAFAEVIKIVEKVSE